MSDKFQEWFFIQKQNISNNSYELEIEDFSKIAWDVCKKEILEIIENQKTSFIFSGELSNFYINKNNLIKEIEKL